MSPRLTIRRNQISEFCRRHHIRKLALFGSVLRADFGSTSDVDVLVEFEPDHVLGLAYFSREQSTNYTLLMAATTLAIIPLIVFFFAAQKQIIQSQARSGLKE